ncbi:hypothetical protein GGX14DRAFT_659577 [Mycena pura]|uniref:Zn(2)-C6 fungal-type domain-containing protein n=1 Tax=Mycena pura TaxID=153505 RepID=A0AAD6V9K3_9AGAR|nr:hypothetical protein GGX14DRAFT_659577 [Mycena pura]
MADQSSTRRRVYIACQRCRQRKIKCITDDSEERPCERCVRMGVECKYISVDREQGQPAATFSVTPTSAGNGRWRPPPANPSSLPIMQAPPPSNAPPMRRNPAPTSVLPHIPGHDKTPRAAPDSMPMYGHGSQPVQPLFAASSSYSSGNYPVNYGNAGWPTQSTIP